MTSFLAIVRVTIRQLTGRTRVLGFGLLSLLPAALVYAASRARDFDGLDTDVGGLLVAPYFAIVLPLTALIIAGAAISDERRDKTLSFLVLRPIGRLRIATAKTVAACLVSFAFGLLGAVAMTATYVALGGRADILPAIAAGAALTCVLYGSLFVLLGNVTSRPTLIGLVYVLFVEQELVNAMPRLASASPWRVGFSATLDLMPRGFPARAQLGAIGELAPSAPLALLATTITAVIALAVLTALLRRTDSV
jgi:ABC-2 type transport system permease protein